MRGLPALPRLPTMSYPVKMTVVGASVGIALIAVLASYFRRRKRRPAYRDIVDNADDDAESSVASAVGAGARRISRRTAPVLYNSRSSNGDIVGVGHSRAQSPGFPLRHNASTSSLSVNMSDVSGGTLVGSTLLNDSENLTPEQLCDLGLESLQTAINHWENALELLDEMTDTTDGPAEVSFDALSTQLHQLLERSYRLQEQFQHQLFRQLSTNVAVESAVAAIAQMDRTYGERRASRHGSSRASIVDDESSDQDSFVSATDALTLATSYIYVSIDEGPEQMADLTDLEDHVEEFQHLVLYEAGLLELKHGTVPYRTLRTRMVNCMSDTEFLAKLHCLRLALQELFRDDTIRNFFITSGRQMIADLLVKAERDPDEFLAAYDEMMSYVKEESHWHTIEEELRGRGVKMLTFYDIVIDFILFDAFDDLENPPSSVTTVVQNRWLSNGFKETALSTAVWSVLKAKRRMLKFPRGFISHFYGISEHVSPVLAWGFLGPPGDLKDLCNYFKDQVMAFMRDVFDFDRVRYTTVEQLADDVLRLARDRIAIASAKLAS